jgi:hypothetical protein
MVQAGLHSGPGMTETMTTAKHGIAAFLIAHSWGRFGHALKSCER